MGDIPLGDCINDTTTTITSLGTPFTGCWKALFAPPEPAHTEVEANHVDKSPNARKADPSLRLSAAKTAERGAMVPHAKGRDKQER